jgi:hypothetical protein
MAIRPSSRELQAEKPHVGGAVPPLATLWVGASAIHAVNAQLKEYVSERNNRHISQNGISRIRI